MCGLFGAAGSNLSKKDKEAVTWLGTLTQIRGKDSTGIVTVHRKGKNFGYRLFKDVVAAPLLLGSKPVKNMLDQDPILIAGHCRWATHGSVKTSNAHPFAVGHYVGMHNGIMPSLFDRKNDKTDTEVLFDAMMKDGIEAGIKKGLDAGCMALVFINKSNGTLNYYRDDDRPLFIGVEKGRKKFFWASQKDHLLHIQDKLGLVKYSDIYDVAPFLLHTIPLGGTERSLTEIKPNPRKVYPVASWPNTFLTSGNSNFSRPIERHVYTPPPSCNAGPMQYERNIIPILGPSPAVDTSGAEKEGGDTIFFRGYKGEFIPAKAARAKLRASNSSCDCCGTDYRLLKPIHWISEDNWLCDDCATDGTVIREAYTGVPMFRGYWMRKDGTAIRIASQVERPYDEVPF